MLSRQLFALALTLLARLTLLFLAETAVLELFEQFVEAVAQGLLALPQVAKRVALLSLMTLFALVCLAVRARRRAGADPDPWRKVRSRKSCCHGARPQTKNLMISITTIRGPAANEKVNDFSSYGLLGALLKLGNRIRIRHCSKPLCAIFALSLGEGNADSAVGSQGRALDALRKGAQGLAQSMQQQMGQGLGPGRSGRLGQPRAQQETDPLGRPLRGRDYGDDYTVKVPGEIDVQRARRIIEELRRRFGDVLRPQEELDYIERLLKDY